MTTGTLANPLVGDDNAGRQVAGRVVMQPFAGLVGGVSAARGPFVTTDALHMAGMNADSRSFTQTAWGGDVEYSRGYYLVRFEAIVSDWELPLIDRPLRAVSSSIEGRYKIRPGLYAAARFDHLDVQHGVAAAARRPVGCARHPPRGRRRLLAAAERRPEGGVPAQHAQTTRAGSADAGALPARLLVLIMTRTQREQRTQRRRAQRLSGADAE